MENLIKEFLKQKSFAVIGSFRNEGKFAFRIFKRLLELGHEVYPVNPRIENVSGHRCYKSLGEIPFPVDVVDIVTPPQVTERLVEECLARGIRRVWVQPGAESEKAIEFCRNNNIEVVHSLCVLTESL